MIAQMQSALLQDPWTDAGGTPDGRRDDAEQQMRAHLIADAAGISDWEDEVYEPAQSPTRHIPNQSNLNAEAQAQSRNSYLGGIAIDVLAPSTSKTLAVIGSGPEAEIQIAAALSHRDFSEMRIFARQPVAAAGVAKKFRDLFPKPIEVCASPEQAVHKADVIILATGATKPIIDADWVIPGVHISCVFPQEMRNNELPSTLLKRAKIIASDCPQFIGSDKQHLMSGLKTRRRVIHLGAMIERFNPDRQRGITVFLISGAQ